MRQVLDQLEIQVLLDLLAQQVQLVLVQPEQPVELVLLAQQAQRVPLVLVQPEQPVELVLQVQQELPEPLAQLV